MTIEMRANEILGNLHYCAKDMYRRDEMLEEMNELEKEMIDLTFNKEHADQGGLWIRDVEDHFRKLNEENGGIADDELQQFVSDCIDFTNYRKGIISGYKGEEMTFKKLEELTVENRVLRNIELTDGNNRTELDAVVLTHKGAWLIEIKNTRRDIFIDEHGQYYRTGEFLRWDSDIGYKMRIKSELLAKLIHEKGYDIPIRCILLFSNNRIQVQNKYRELTTCFLSQLNHLIGETTANDVLTTTEMEKLAEDIGGIIGTDQFPIKTDVTKMKRDYAVLMAKLEAANEQTTAAEKAAAEDIQPEEPEMTEVVKPIRHPVRDWLKCIVRNPYVRGSAGTAAAAGLLMIVRTAIKSRL